MKRDMEDRLVRLAFGDVGPEEAAELERDARSDPDASARLAEYRRLKADLRSLHEVPDDQLSSERLRHAILNQGLRSERPARSRFGWLWMPAAAAAIAFALITIRLPGTTGDPLFVMGERPVASPEIPWDLGDGVALAFPGGEFDFGPSVQEPVAAAQPEENPPVRRTVVVSNRRPASPPRTSSTSSSSARAEEQKNDLLAPDRAPDRVAANPPSAGTGGGGIGSLATAESGDQKRAEALGASSGGPTLVIIEPVRDQQTGAWKATEVENANNVVIGS
jgi:hypothetical protein